MNKKILFYATILLVSFGIQAQSSLDERVARLEQAINTILKTEQKNSETINRLATSVLEKTERFNPEAEPEENYEGITELYEE